MAASVNNVLYGINRLLFGNPATHATPAAMPADTAAYGAAHTGWTEETFTTDAGLTLSGLSPDVNPLNISQQRAPLLYIPQLAVESLACVAVDFTVANVKRFASRGAIASVAPGAGTPGHDELTLSDTNVIAFVGVLAEVYAPDGNPFRIHFPVAMVRLTGDIAFAATTPTTMPIQVQRVGGSQGDVKIRRVLPATS